MSNPLNPTPMKKILFAFAMLISFQLQATTEKPVKSSINKVTVFTQGAQVFRSAPVTLSPGTTQLVFAGVSPQINPSSIQAGGKGTFVVTDVKHEIKYPEPPSEKAGELPAHIRKEITLLEDSVAELGFRRDEISERLTAHLIQKDMITKNKLSRGEGKADSLEVLIKAMDFFQKKLNELNSLIGKTKRDQAKVNKQITTTNNRLQELKTYKADTEPEKKYEPIHRVLVTVSAEAAATGTVEVSYMVSGAGWTPSYDLRSVSATAPIQLTYKAGVFQNTGEDWNDVKLKLSTNNPNRTHVKPELPIWYINYFTAQRPAVFLGGARPQSTDNVRRITAKEEATYGDAAATLSPAQSAANYSQLIETMTNVEFDIRLAYDIPSDGGSHVVSVKTDELPATYVHYLVPKIEKEAFLIARVTGWENLSLLPGPANLFYEGTYVGQTVLNPSVINDTLTLALGRDNGITVTRTRLPEKEKSKLIGTEVTKTIAWQLRMKSNKSKAIKLIIEDQVPVSNNKDIRVEVKDTGKAELNDTTGLLKWEVSIEPKAMKELKFSYEVTHNKDMPLSMY
jgi:uncharacterized protein (TIGR02231 family)